MKRAVLRLGSARSVFGSFGSSTSFGSFGYSSFGIDHPRLRRDLGLSRNQKVLQIVWRLVLLLQEFQGHLSVLEMLVKRSAYTSARILAEEKLCWLRE